MLKATFKGFLKLLRLPYWLMTGGLALLTLIALKKEDLSIDLMALTFFSMAFLGSAGFAINDYFDKESDAVIKPTRPIPSGELSPEAAVGIAAVLFIVAFIISYMINLVSLTIVLVDAFLLIVYSAYVKRWSGLVANILVGLLTGTSFLYGEAAGFGAVTAASASVFPICLGTIGGNILRDILSMDGDAKVNYPTLPLRVGVEKAVKIAVPFFIICALSAPMPYILNIFSVAYLVCISIWSLTVLYSAASLLKDSSW
ncbi:UbiA family prenyltransferase, partial [Candidatus Bathyarchaeota archaeon]|nr:UbiA family prenyltransferase [Candidatus Bathyarchaeota archaeon]